MAKVTNDYFDGSSRKVESDLGWSRHTVHKGLKELETGFVCLDNYPARGRKKTEAKLPTLEADIHHLVQGQSQVDGRTFQCGEGWRCSPVSTLKMTKGQS